MPAHTGLVEFSSASPSRPPSSSTLSFVYLFESPSPAPIYHHSSITLFYTVFTNASYLHTLFSFKKISKWAR